MRIVPDTNVVISALLWRGKPFQLLEAVRHGPRFALYSSGVLLEELADVLTRSSAAKHPDDDAVLALAVSASADLVVSGDNDLLVLEQFEGVPIVNAAQALALVAPAS